jgi:hypothetical protein
MPDTLTNFDPIQIIREMAEGVYAAPVAGCDQERFDTFTDQCAALRLVLQRTPAINRCSAIHQMFANLRDSGLSGVPEAEGRVAILKEIAALSTDAAQEQGAAPGTDD